VNSRPVQQVSCSGYSALTEELRGSCARIVDSWSQALGLGWLPPKAWEDPVKWRPRKHNTVADFLVNHTMNAQETWFKLFDWPHGGHTLQEVNILIHADGGTRKGRCSASAWIAEVGILGETGWLFKPLAMSGTYFSTPVSSFAAETFALEESALFLKRLLERDIEHESLGKRRRVTF